MGPIQQRAEELLLQKDKSGFAPSHAGILGILRKEFPENKISYVALRWYKNKMQKRGVELPQQYASPRGTLSCEKS